VVRHGHLPKREIMTGKRRFRGGAERAARQGRRRAVGLDGLPAQGETWSGEEIWMAATKAEALVAFDAFVKTWTAKYGKAVECLIKDRDALLAFYDFPAEHWKHLRSTNVIS